MFTAPFLQEDSHDESCDVILFVNSRTTNSGYIRRYVLHTYRRMSDAELLRFGRKDWCSQKEITSTLGEGPKGKARRLTPKGDGPADG